MKKDDKESHLSETFAIIAIVATLIAAILMLTSCDDTTAQTPEEKVYIEMSDGNKIELVADEYGNQYLKEYTRAGRIYIPYPGETEEEDTLHFYNAKNQ